MTREQIDRFISLLIGANDHANVSFRFAAILVRPGGKRQITPDFVKDGPCRRILIRKLCLQ